MPLRILIVGATGLLGEACARILAQKEAVEVIAVTRNEVDLEDLEAVRGFFYGTDFDVLINAAAISGLEACLAEPEKAMSINALAPEIMAGISDQKGAKMIQISTDYVFSGEQDVKVSEDCQPAPISVYGKTKHEAEVKVMQQSSNALVARVSWLFGKGRASFVDQVIETVLKGEVCEFIADKYSVPNYCDDLVEIMWELIKQDAKGVIHLTNDADPESWHSYAEKIIKSAKNLGMAKSYSQAVIKVRLSEAAFFKEKRPRHTAMISNRLSNEYSIDTRIWKEGMVEYLQWKLEHYLTNGR